MNRLLMIPLVAVCAGFVALVFVNANPTIIAAASGPSDDAIDGRLPGLAAIEQSLLAKWDELTPQSYSFSRVMRPQPRYSRPEILVDLDCPVPEQIFVGSIRLYRFDTELVETNPHQDFAMIVDRKSGKTAVYSGNQWIQYDQWVLSLTL